MGRQRGIGHRDDNFPRGRQWALAQGETRRWPRPGHARPQLVRLRDVELLPGDAALAAQLGLHALRLLHRDVRHRGAQRAPGAGRPGNEGQRGPCFGEGGEIAT